MTIKFSAERLLQVLIAPQISEKATFVSDRFGQVVFIVKSDAKKPEIRAAVELLFKVKVGSVKTSVAKGKQKKFGRFLGARGDTKKAFVSLLPGQEINFSEGAF